MAPEVFQLVESLNGELMSSILHLLPLIHPLFNCADPDPYQIQNTNPDSQRVLNTDAIWIQIHNTGYK